MEAKKFDGKAAGALFQVLQHKRELFTGMSDEKLARYLADLWRLRDTNPRTYENIGGPSEKNRIYEIAGTRPEIITLARKLWKG